ncbi:hypothetical protein OG782_15250 [Streptomyces sp. NBC_00876]|uniref:hypothetical protein n=1 Tax=Streptomyces sp. NBC_00876 TaxID=2975853 RepID=UPI003866EFCB|nr:hypothetical protein OG782_15250 [Streptomyces sp. NBC_00876]
MTIPSRVSLGYLPPVSFDQAYGDRELRTAAHALVRRSDWRPARDLLLAGGSDWALKDHRVDYLARKAVGSRVLWEWANAEPSDADPLTVLSRSEIVRAWAIRGTTRAKYVRKNAWPKFFGILAHADSLAAQAGKRAPLDPTPRATALHTARGLEVPRREFDARWASLIACDPLHRTGHRHALQYLCAKWSGSHKEMFRFARKAAEEAPDGHPLVVLPLVANLEMRMADENMGLGSARFTGDFERLQARWIGAHPLQHPRIVEDHTLIAFYLHLLRRSHDAATHYRAMGRCGSTEGWMYDGRTPRTAFVRARAAALRYDSGQTA